ncbi:mortality factor 4-like protein 1 [Culex quinquefasciatus]|uniref:mortality factor 4-like protein 1 n=1 Tax=Culex quinquefasciatus TaxID=7176 RepID=UPI0018E35A0B|nr:mortality factor 4-like protein 1 [Culex quinquefasciatus]
MPPKLKFSEGEKVLCFHGPLIYEAKLLKSMVMKDKQVKYFIHYAGWNKNWDEWVPENRVLKYNEANVQRQKEVTKLHSSLAAKNKKANAKAKKADTSAGSSKDGDSRASTPSKEVGKEKDGPSSSSDTPGTVTPTTSASSTASTAPAPTSSRSRSSAKSAGTPVGAAGTPVSTSTPTAATPSTTTTTKDKSEEKETPIEKRKSEDPPESGSAAARKKRGRSDTTSSNVESEDQFLSKVEVKIKIPDELKPWLVDDWDAISRQNKLVELPAKSTVEEIVENYVQYKKASKVSTAVKESAVQDIAKGIIEYFNVMLGSQLLYKFERPQYAEMIQTNPGVPMAKIYGAFHLLRLFVRLGSMLAFTALDEKAVQSLIGHIQDFLKYLVKNSSTLFNMQQFVNASPEYHRKAL